MEVKINREGCISCGLCIETCPEVFQFADDGLAEVIAPPAPSNEEAVREAAGGCPVNVIETEG
ncbi:MAG: ferredoxin [Clostridia bacterium]|nr:ferredoxin [Clostridia bacterium]